TKGAGGRCGHKVRPEGAGGRCGQKVRAEGANVGISLGISHSEFRTPHSAISCGGGVVLPVLEHTPPFAPHSAIAFRISFAAPARSPHRCRSGRSLPSIRSWWPT